MSQHADPVRTVPEQEGQPIAPDAQAPAGDHPAQIGRYRVERLLGEGGFGRVYLAHDDQLHRPVAVKVPRPERAGRPGYADSYLAEARILAGLDHPHIVPVHDVGRSDDGLPFVVSKFIPGSDLAKIIRESRPSSSAAAALVATVAEALHYAHRQGLVHRDVKPGNILLDTGGRPYVADFGLALREEDFGRGAGFSGTPAYMSPEQARGEGHRVDGRSDLFSLGVVFYELLSGRRPFRGETPDELLEQITSVEPRPLRQVDDSIPRELERICLKALAKRATERYPTGLDLADDLRHFLDESAPVESLRVPARGAAAEAPTPTPTPPVTIAPTPLPVKIVPRGLRSFDAHDADFFLELLPGPRDREGLPDSIRFWKTRIEETDPDNTFSVGLIYGPSGCGKSSLVKAGLLPRLAGPVVAVYVEATANDTETRLLKGLRKNCTDLPDGPGLIETVAALRRGRGLPAGKKVLIVLDQFEQWLHARKEEEHTEVVQALRQCDGRRVQCLVLVRDDFWMAATRFLRELEVRLVEGRNSAAVDLFDLRHARRVLAAFGRAFGALPETVGEPTKEQDAFLDQAVAGLAQDRKVISVRLVLFAEMVKEMPWAPATLREVGGTAGVGVTFLEETFSAATAPPEHRYHQKAARAVLKALLPESGTDIKGHMRSYAELLAASGYTSRPGDFDDLIRILDSEIRLITPTDPEGASPVGQDSDPVGQQTGSESCPTGDRFYQLTHDYLVPSLRDWLTRKQRETRRGRADLRLAERAALWHGKPENRHLPAWWEWLNVRLFTRKTDWTPPQKAMMRRATRYHGLRGGVLAVLLVVGAFAGLTIRDRVVEQNNATHAAGLVRSLLDADTAGVPDIVRELDDYRRWADPLLRQANAEAADGSRQQLHTALALLPVEPGRRDDLAGRLLDAEPHEVAVLREALRPHREELKDRLWAAAEAPPPGRPGQRLRAAYALAAYDPDGGRWANVAGPLGRQFVTENVVHLGIWLDGFRPIKERLLPALAEVFRDRGEGRAGERSLATSILADYAADWPDVLADLLMDADDKQFAALFAKLKGHGARAAAPLLAELDRQATFRWDDKPLDPAWQTAGAAPVRQIEAAQGLVAEHFALCQTLPLEEFPAVAEALWPAGYRPLRLRPFARGPGAPVLVAALWARDGRDWHLRHDLAAAAVAAADAEQQKEGYRPADAAGYLAAGQERYAVVWVRGDGKEEAKLFTGVSTRDLRGATQALREQEFQPATLHVLTLPGDEVRYSSVWRKPAPAGPALPSLSEIAYADQLALDVELPIDVSLSFSDEPLRDVAREAVGWLAGTPWPLLAFRSGQRDSADLRGRYASVWQADGTREYADLRGLDPAAHRERCRELAGRGYRPAALAVAEERPGQALRTASVWHRPVVAEDDRERLAKRQASAGVALLRLGEGEHVWPLLKHSPDPRVRSYLVHRLSPLGADPEALVQRLGEEPDVTIRRALLLCLGQFGENELPAARRAALLPRLFALYRDDPDPGIHGSAAWLLGQWGQRPRLKEIDGELAGRDKDTASAGRLPAGGRRWYVNGQGQTMAIVPGPSPFWMGSPRTEKEREGGADDRTEQRHRKVIGRTYAIAAHEVTVAQFRRFLGNHDYNKTYSPTPEHPVNTVTGYQAAEYCNWLSKQEGISPRQWCYEVNPDPAVQNEKRIRLKPNYLGLSGYRLPSEAEWECACRAGAVTARHYGETDELLGRYAWYTKVSADKGTLPVGSLEPNDLGLFDMQGNVMEWCHAQILYYGPSLEEDAAASDGEYSGDIVDSQIRVLRGAAFSYLPWNVRSSYRNRRRLTDRDYNVGFRPARTFR